MQKAPTTAKQAASVTEMARLVRLSRSRFYQLMDLGIFPQPMRHPRTKRPYFDHEQQAQCEAVRASGRGVNGEPVLFATMLRRSKKSEDVVKRPREQQRGNECVAMQDTPQPRLHTRLRRGGNLLLEPLARAVMHEWLHFNATPTCPQLRELDRTRQGAQLSASARPQGS